MSTLSERWLARRHDALRAADGDTPLELALILGAVRSVVRIVDRSQPPLTVEWSGVNEDNYGSSRTDIINNRTWINPAPVLDTGVPVGDAMDICVGYGIHEAGHSQESRSRITDLIEIESDEVGVSEGEPVFRQFMRPRVEPMRVAMWLFNVIEDVRSESETGAKWPGFAAYLRKTLDYVWTGFFRKHGVPEYGPALKDKLGFVFVACRFPEQAAGNGLLPAAEREWWQDWQRRYLAGTKGVADSVREAIDHLAETPAAKEEIEQMVEHERWEREDGERLDRQMKRLLEEGIDGAPETCFISRLEGRTQLDPMTAREVQERLDEQAAILLSPVPQPGRDPKPVFVTKPVETELSRRNYVGRPDHTAEALRSALVFRQAAPEAAIKLLPEGAIDDTELYRWGLGDMRVFGQREIENKPDALLGLLVDLSGSMRGHKLQIAQHLAQVFVWALHGQEGVRTKVWGHTADTTPAKNADVFRLWEPGDPLSRLGLIATLPHNNNADGHAIAYCVSQMRDEPEPEKVLVVLSDGLPSAYPAYGDAPARQHVRQVCRWAQRHGVRVIQVAISPYDLRPEQQAEMYGANWVPFRSEAELPRQLTRIIGEFA